MRESDGEVRETSSYSAKNLALRYAICFAGVVINSFGIALITKGALGTSPISSVPYVLSLAFPAWSFGLTTFVMGMLLIVLQMVLLRRDFQPVQLLQIVVNVVFSEAIDVSMSLLAFLEPSNVVAQVASVVVGCCFLAFGVTIEVAPNAVFVPGEGAVRAIAAVSKIRFGTVKIAFDSTLVAIGIVLSFVFFGSLQGIGVGTIISAFLVGKIVNLCNARLPFVERIRELAR